MRPNNINKYIFIKKHKIKPSKLRSLKEKFRFLKKTFNIKRNK